MATWTKEMREAEINRKLALIENNPVPMAVVDYGCGWRKSGASSRFGTRDLNHVAIYKLNAVAFNPAAWRKAD